VGTSGRDKVNVGDAIADTDADVEGATPDAEVDAALEPTEAELDEA
jgi:hypothetical protein